MIPQHIPHLYWEMTCQKLLICRHSFGSKHSGLFLFLLHKQSFCQCVFQQWVCTVCARLGLLWKILPEKQERVITSTRSWPGISRGGWRFWSSRRGCRMCCIMWRTFSSILGIICIKQHLSEIRISEYILSCVGCKHWGQAQIFFRYHWCLPKCENCCSDKILFWSSSRSCCHNKLLNQPVC